MSVASTWTIYNERRQTQIDLRLPPPTLMLTTHARRLLALLLAMTDRQTDNLSVTLTDTFSSTKNRRSGRCRGREGGVWEELVPAD